MPAIDNPLKNFDFTLELTGLGTLGLQQVVTPDVEWTVHKHGKEGNGPDRKTPGKKVVGDMTAEYVIPIEGGDSPVWLWFLSAQLGVRAGYARPGILRELDGQGNTVATAILDSVWLQKINGTTHDTRQDNSADLMRSVVFSVEDYIHT